MRICCRIVNQIAYLDFWRKIRWNALLKRWKRIRNEGDISGQSFTIRVDFVERESVGGCEEDDDDVAVFDWLKYWRLEFNWFKGLNNEISKSVKYESLSKWFFGFNGEVKF